MQHFSKWNVYLYIWNPNAWKWISLSVWYRDKATWVTLQNPNTLLVCVSMKGHLHLHDLWNYWKRYLPPTLECAYSSSITKQDKISNVCVNMMQFKYVWITPIMFTSLFIKRFIFKKRYIFVVKIIVLQSATCYIESEYSEN